MNRRERFLAICNFEPVDYVPIMRFHGFVGGAPGGWLDLTGAPSAERARAVSLFPPAGSTASLTAYLGIDAPELIPIHVGMWPTFEYKLLDLPEDDRELVQLPNGQISLQVVNNPRRYAMPQFIEFPVKTREDWEAIKERYRHHDQRYPRNWEQLVEQYRQRDTVLRLGAGAGYVPGFYGSARALLGFERLSFTYYDDPQLIKDISEHTVNFLIETLDRCFSEVEVDLVVIGEDMAGRNGSLISPAMFREFMMPYYKRFTAFCRDHRVGTIWVDSDGDMRDLIPLWIESGINGIGPCDNVLGQVDVVELREAFPGLIMAGGIDKRIIEQGRTFAEIDAELEHKVRPLLRGGGYFPGPDHGWTPQASLENYLHYVEKLREICQDL